MTTPPASAAETARPTLRALSSIADLPAEQWDACANANPEIPTGNSPEGESRSLRTCGRPYNPFVSHAFLSALEASGSATARTGWQPRHLVAVDHRGEAVGIAPCYLKSHSRGEYVFDQAWADAYERAGGHYYPKLQVSVPFTPATGPRLLIRPCPKAAQTRELLGKGLIALCAQIRASSLHATFLPEEQAQLLAAQGYLTRTDQQFHWFNAGYATFSDFLAALASRKRKAIQRERRDALADGGISVHWLTGADLTEDIWDAFFAFYMDTGSRKWGTPYLKRSFFSLVSESMRDRIVLVMAKRAGRWIAGALNFIGGDRLFGRHWGANEDHPFLHFELCYYQAIDYAIAHKLACVEAGAQGEHKLARGYLPVTTYSSHYIADPALRRAVADYLAHERSYVDAAGRELATLAPFRKTEKA